MFLDNSGDILLDAVLTDTGRKAMANGTFKITKFALGDDEIDYSLFNKNHASGSAYYGLEILKLPVEQAHTKADISQKYRLIRMLSSQLLYLPELKLDQVTQEVLDFVSGRDAYAVITDDNTYDKATATGTVALTNGFLDGRSATNSLTRRIMTPLGLDGGSTDWKLPLSQVSEQLEATQYNITVDGRFLQISQPVGADAAGPIGALVQPSAKSAVYSSGDNLKTYTITVGTNPDMFRPGPNQLTQVFNAASTANILTFSFVAQGNLDYLFTTYTDESVTDYGGVSGCNVDVIRTSVDVQSEKGFRLTVPIDFIRQS